jgi:diacylglycerol O-acyltransferase
MGGVRASWRALGGEDSGFLALELPGQPMTNLYLIVLAAGSARPGDDGEKGGDETRRDPPSRLTVEDVRERLEARLAYLPSLRWKLLTVPYGLHHPLWVDDPNIDLGRHIRTARLDAPGDRDQLEAICGQMAAEQLDRSKPLWDVTLVDGLQDGGQAIIWRAHHCLMDGVATVTTLERFLAEDGGFGEIPPVEFRPGIPPTRREMRRAAIRTDLRNLRRLPRLLRRTGRALKKRDAFEQAAPATIPRAPRDVPPCSLNDAFGADRRVTTFTLDLPAVKQVRERAGTSFTNVVLAVTAGALRAILLKADDLPARPLIVGCPILLDDPNAAPRQWGNRFSNIVTTLATDVEDPWERLMTISAVTDASRRSVEMVGEKLWEDWLETLPPFAMSAIVRRLHAHRRKHRDVVNSSATVSSVPGPSRPWRLAGVTVDEVYLNGQPRDAGGPAIALFSYAGKLCVGMVSVPESMPHPKAFAEAAQVSLGELVSAASARRASP